MLFNGTCVTTTKLSHSIAIEQLTNAFDETHFAYDFDFDQDRTRTLGTRRNTDALRVRQTLRRFAVVSRVV